MSMEVVPSLQRLLASTREMIAQVGTESRSWEEYWQNRERIFMSLETASFQLPDRERKKAIQLIREILAEDAALASKIEKELRLIRGQMTGLARGRQAIRGYRSV